MEISVKYLPYATILLLVLIIIIITEKHVTGSKTEGKDLEGVNKDLGSCLFAQALNILWVLLSFIIYIKYRQVKDILNRYNISSKKRWNKITMQTGLASAFGVSIIANFQEIKLFYFYYLGTVIALGLGSAYVSLQSVLYFNLKQILGQKRTTWMRVVLSAISVITFVIYFICCLIAFAGKNGGIYLQGYEESNGFNPRNISLISEWISAISSILYITLFCWEFKKITLYEPDVFVEDKITIELNAGRSNEGFESA